MNEEINKNVLKTGTVTIGIVCKDGIVLAADRRTSFGGQGGVSYLAGKAKKVLDISKKLIATMAGVASDAKKVASIIGAEIRLKELKTREEVSVKEAAHLTANMVFQNIRTPSMIPSISHFLLAGYDSKGTHLYDISPDGYIEEVKDYAVSGAGLMQVHPILDSEYKKEISLQDGIKLAVKSINAAMKREPSVGAGLDIYTIKDGEIKEVLAQEAVLELRDEK